jgi:hypothetical protein
MPNDYLCDHKSQKFEIHVKNMVAAASLKIENWPYLQNQLSNNLQILSVDAKQQWFADA